MMMKYLIAGHVIAIERISQETGRSLEAYRYTGEEMPEETFAITPEALKKAGEEWLQSYQSEIEEFLLSRKFSMWLAGQNGMYLHAAAVAYGGWAYAFTAPPGTGKSTHAHLWRQTFGAEILNDDKPFVCLRDGAFYICGSPWCGKERLHVNRMVPLRAICFLEQGKTNEIRPLESAEAAVPLLRQTLLPEGEREMDRLMTLMDALLANVPTFRMRCNISEQAVRTAFEGMRPREEEET